MDLDGIAILPTFEAQSRSQHHAISKKLIEQSRGETLLSGLARNMADRKATQTEAERPGGCVLGIRA